MSRVALYRCCMLAFLLATLSAVDANAHRTGGAIAPARPEIDELRCLSGDVGQCAPGGLLRLRGDNLQTVRVVMFSGDRGPADDLRATAESASHHRVLVHVPASAQSGPVRVVSRAGSASAAGPRLELSPPEESTETVDATAVATAGSEGVFPVRAAHNFGTAVNGFGGGRNHQGQDILTDCGEPVVAALAGTVSTAQYEDAAGNLVVVDAADGSSQAYMHLLEPGAVRPGEQVTAGQEIGRVGQTGRASACHLHFELWTSPGWQQGGSPIDPIAQLRLWEAAA
jgi:murein DD-endopeptidase MepM/ murein hydrolase activator NlpD